MIPAPDLDLRLTLDSGQFFRWEERDGGYLVRERGQAALIRPVPGGIALSGARAPWARRFFALDVDFAEARAAIRHPRVAAWAAALPGLRLLRQDPWECAVTFLLSMASNQPRIRRNVATLAERFGRNGALPRPNEMPAERDLRDAGVGFRAPYLIAAARDPSWLSRVEPLGTDEAIATLCEIHGISHKVAECILLFAYGRHECFPIDVWIRRVVQRDLLRRRAADTEIRAWARATFGRWAGFAQQVIYVTGRTRGSAVNSPAAGAGGRAGLPASTPPSPGE